MPCLDIGRNKIPSYGSFPPTANKNEESRIEIISAERTLIRLLHPLFDASSVIDMLAGQLFDQLVLLKTLDADRAGL